MINPKRVRHLKKTGHKSVGPVCYWMSRDQRAEDNWALVFSHELAASNKVGLLVVFCLTSPFLGATERQYSFMIGGLKEIHRLLKARSIPFHILTGDPADVIPGFIKENKISCIVSDFDPLRIKKEWKKELSSKIDIDFYEVDAHNIVPCWIASDKQEYGAYTIRPKIKRHLPDFLEDYPRLISMPNTKDGSKDIDWDLLKSRLKIDRKVKTVSSLRPGPSYASDVLGDFIEKKLVYYKDKSNDPSEDFQSGLSPYIHFGQISSQRIAIEVEKLDVPEDIKQPFLEQLIIRKELSDNFCNYNRYYDSWKAFPKWALKTLGDHVYDKREHIYTLDELEDANTHDPLWNACQKEMLFTGKMHGYMRMYWAKKILEWSRDHKEATRSAIYLNDRYELDGRDPNGYTGIAWSIGGLHDRAWKERDVFGKIRFMSYNGARSKFDISKYIDRIEKEYG